MQIENLYTKYKFSEHELNALCNLFKTNPKGVVEKLDRMSYEAKKLAYMFMSLTQQAKNE